MTPLAADPRVAPYLEHTFPGRRLLAISVAIFVVAIILPALFLNSELLPKSFLWLQLGACLIALPLYLLGFWRAVLGKGYPPVLFLLAFSPLIGLLAIYYLPARTENPPINAT